MNSSCTHFVFVDFENVSEVDLRLAREKPVHVTLLLGKNQKKLDVGLVKQIHELASQVALVELAGSGRNALDLTLAFYLGRAVERSPDARFYVVSKDKDFDPMLTHLVTHGIEAERVDAFADVSIFGVQKKTEASVAPVNKPTKVAARKLATAGTATRAEPPENAGAERTKQILARLRNTDNIARPSTVEKLLAYVRNGLGKDATEAAVAAVIEAAENAGTLTIDARSRIKYAPRKSDAQLSKRKNSSGK
jgi:hypothetical protein